jgi:hypothetical protein
MFSPLDIVDQIKNYFQSAEFLAIVFWGRVISYSISILLISAMLILLSRSRAVWWVQESMDSFRKAKLPQRMKRDWEKINDRLGKADEASLKLALIEADNMLDEVLKRMGLEGRDMGERLEQLGVQQLKSYDSILEAHRLRDLVIHQKEMVVTQEQVQTAVNAYGEALKELEVI